MKKGLSGIELKFLVEEWQQLLGARITKIYQPVTEEVYLQFYGTNSGKKLIRIMPPGFMFLTEFKEESPQSPLGFCQNLRKWLEGSEAKEIKQVGLERIVEFVFQNKETTLRLIIELFAKGNIILCQDDYTIISCLSSHKYKDRDIRPRQKYIFPQAAANPYKLSRQEFEKILLENSTEAIGGVIAVRIGLGPLYSDEVCILSGIDKSKKNLGSEEKEKVYASIWLVLARPAQPTLITGVDAVPIELEIYSNVEKSKVNSYNEALCILLTQSIGVKKADKLGIEKGRLCKIIETQGAGITRMEEEIIQNQKKAELIYENYQTMKDVLEGVNSEIRKTSKEELITKYKLKELNAKDKCVTVEL